MGHPIIDGLLIGAAAGVGANLASQAMQPGQIPIWTGTCADGMVITVVQTRTHRYEIWGVAGQYQIPMGSYPNWVTLVSGVQVWGDYLREKAAAGVGAAAALGQWSARNAAAELERQRYRDDCQAELAAKRAAKPSAMWWLPALSLAMTVLFGVTARDAVLGWWIWGGMWTVFWAALAIRRDRQNKMAAAALRPEAKVRHVKVRHLHCGHVQQVPEFQWRYVCDGCGANVKRKEAAGN
jgi:hypothetical protein